MTRIREAIASVILVVLWIVLGLYMAIAILIYLPFSKDMRDLVFRGIRHDPPSRGVWFNNIM